MLTEKIKQRLLGLLGVCIILMAFLPVILEEPFTLLKVTPTRVPEWPALPHPQALFASISGAAQQMRGRIDSERAQMYQALQADAPGLPDLTQQREALARFSQSILAQDRRSLIEQRELTPLGIAPIDALTTEEPATKEPVTKEPVTKEPVAGLKRAWTIALMENGDRAALEREREQLKRMELRSYIRTVNDGEGQIYQLFVGPQLLRRKADAILITLKSHFPVTNPIILPYFPG